MSTIAELAYMAGILDGEGYVSVSSRGRGAVSGHRYFAAALTLEMSDRAPLDLFAKHFGSKVYVRNGGVAKFNKVTFLYRANPGAVGAILQALYPFLLVKKANADIVLEFVRLRARTRAERTKVVGIKRVGLNYLRTYGSSDSYVVECTRLRDAAKALNHRKGNGMTGKDG